MVFQSTAPARVEALLFDCWNHAFGTIKDEVKSWDVVAVRTDLMEAASLPG